MKKALLILLMLSACASTQPNYTPDGPETYQAWRACRVAYEQDHPIPVELNATSLLLGAAAADMMNTHDKLEGPAMDKAIDACMKGKGYGKAS